MTSTTRRGTWERGALALMCLAFALLAAGCREATATAPVPTEGGASAPAGASGSASGSAQVRLLTGGAHTVHHSEAPLPTAQTPRADGKPTLIWFSATWCTTCASMEGWATDTANEFAARAAFIEKSVDHDRSAVSTYTVRGTPTFVVIDASGREVSRFFVQTNAVAFRAAIEDAFRKAGV